MGNDEEKWIQDMTKSMKKKHTKGSLRKQLKIKDGDKVPLTFLVKIMDADTGRKVMNPTKTGIKSIVVTDLLKKRANAALNLIRISKSHK